MAAENASQEAPASASFGTSNSSGNLVAAVIGGTGVVGGYLLQQLSRPSSPFKVVYAVSRRAVSGGDKVTSVQLDLSTGDPEAREKMGDLGVTHLFFAGYAGTVDVDANVALLANAVAAVESPALQHVHLVEGTKWYGYGLLPGAFKTPAKESDPRCLISLFYYHQQDLLMDRVNSGACAWSWSASRPHAVVGFSVGSAMNLTLSIAVYASMCKELGTPFHFPGTQETYDAIYQMTDSSLLAKSIEWMSCEPQCANEAFNITNGDFIRWQNVWARIAGIFGLEVGRVRTMKLTEVMQTPDKQRAWDRLVARHGLSAEYGYTDLVPNWNFADFVLHAGVDVMSDTSKCRRFGFYEFEDTADMLMRSFQELIDKKIVAGPGA